MTETLPLLNDFLHSPRCAALWGERVDPLQPRDLAKVCVMSMQNSPVSDGQRSKVGVRDARTGPISGGEHTFQHIQMRRLEVEPLDMRVSQPVFHFANGIGHRQGIFHGALPGHEPQDRPKDHHDEQRTGDVEAHHDLAEAEQGVHAG